MIFNRAHAAQYAAFDCNLLSLILRASENGGHLSENEALKEEKRLLVSQDDLDRAIAEGIASPLDDGEEFVKSCGVDPEGLLDFFGDADVPAHERESVAAAICLGVVAAGIRDERITEGF